MTSITQFNPKEVNKHKLIMTLVHICDELTSVKYVYEFKLIGQNQGAITVKKK